MPRARALSIANLAGQVAMFGIAVRHAPRRALLAATLMYGSAAVWIRDLIRDG